jgi:hypothetical protein
VRDVARHSIHLPEDAIYAFQQTLCGEELMSERRRLRRLAGAVLERQTYIGAVFHNRNERWQALLSVVTEGIDPGWHSAYLSPLKAAGIDMAAAERSHHLKICGRVGRFAISEPP